MQVSESVKKIHGYAKMVKRSTNASLKKNKEVAAKWNIQQMETGKDRKGQSLGEYDPATEGYNYKRKTKISAGEPIKLKDTGDYHEGMYRGTKVKDNIMEIKSADWKDEMLAQTYDPLGLNEAHMKELMERIYRDLVTDIKDYFK